MSHLLYPRCAGINQPSSANRVFSATMVDRGRKTIPRSGRKCKSWFHSIRRRITEQRGSAESVLRGRPCSCRGAQTTVVPPARRYSRRRSREHTIANELFCYPFVFGWATIRSRVYRGKLVTTEDAAALQPLVREINTKMRECT